jgi:adenosine deaminase CECR1
MAAEACAIVDQIRFEEQQTMWTKEYEDSIVKQHVDVFPGMMFSLAKDRMEKSKLWKIVNKMPKGALLHCHLEAMVDLDWALEEAFKLKGVCITSNGPLSSPTERLKTGFSFTYSKIAAKDDVSVWSDTYKPNTPVLLTTAADSFSDGGREGFIDWVRSRTTITPEEHLKHHEGPNEAWRKFLSCFPILGSLIYYEPVYRKFVRKMCKQLLDDGVSYVDMRSAFYTPYRCAEADEWDKDSFNMLAHMEDEIEAFKKSEEGKGFWGGRMIWTTVRQFDKRKVIESRLSLFTLVMNIPIATLSTNFVRETSQYSPSSYP